MRMNWGKKQKAKKEKTKEPFSGELHGKRRRFWNRSIMIGMFVLFAMILVALYFIGKRMEQKLTAQTIEVVQSIAKQENNLISGTINGWYDYATVVCQICVEDDTLIEERKETITGKLNNGVKTEKIYLFDENGEGVDENGDPFSVAEDENFEVVLEGENSVSAVMDMNQVPGDEIEEEQVLIEVMVPALDADGHVVGGAVAYYPGSYLQTLMENDTLDQVGDTVLMDADGTIIIGSKNYESLEDMFDSAQAQERQEFKEDIRHGNNAYVKLEENQENRYMVYQNNDATDWVVATTVNEDELVYYSKDLSSGIMRFIIVCVSLIFVLFLVIFFMFRYLLRLESRRRNVLEEDIEQEITKRENLEDLAMQDSMTKLLNKPSVIEQSRQFLSEEGKDGNHAFLFADIDNFKGVNDKFGHDEGDRLILLFADTIRRNFRDTDLVGRFGGDEFIVLIKNYGTISNLERLAARLCASILEESEQASYPFSVSVGLSLYPNDGTGIEVLMERADQALYQAKQSGKNQFRFYSEMENQEKQEDKKEL